MKPINPYLAFGLSLVMAVGAAVGTYSARNASQETKLDDMQRRLDVLEDVVRKDTATRRDLDDVKSTVEKIYANQQKLYDFELRYHKAGK